MLIKDTNKLDEYNKMGLRSKLDDICDAPISDYLVENIDKRMPYIMSTLRHKRSPLKDYSDDQLRKHILDMTEWDPTGDKFVDYIARQVRDRRIDLPNDGPRMLNTLTTFNKIRNTGRLANQWKQFKGGQYVDINRYKNWRELEGLIEEFVGDEDLKGSKDQQRTLKVLAEEGSELVFETDIPTRSGTKNVKIYRLDTPAACVFYGMNSRWCTSTLHDTHANADARPPYIVSHGIKVPYLERGQYKGYPTTAANYLSRGPLYVIYVDDKPYIQMTNNFSEVRNTQDAQLERCSRPLDTILGMWSHKITDKDTIRGINKIRKRIAPQYANYPGRLPLVDIGDDD